MTYHCQVYENDKWVDCSPEYFESFKGEKRHGPYGRESYVYTDADGRECEFNPWNFMTEMLANYAGRTTHSTWLNVHRYVDDYI